MKTYFHVNVEKKCVSLMTLFCLFFSQSAFGAVNIINGDFNDTTGMSVNGGWYDGIPAGWSTTGVNQYVINNNTLNLDHVGTFSQNLGTVEVGGEDIKVSFEYGDIWNG